MIYEGKYKAGEDTYLPRCSFPVGFVVQSFVQLDCAKEFGGEWEQIKGVFLAAIDNNDTDTNKNTSFNQAVGTKFGSKYLQSHSHLIRHKGGTEWQQSDAFADQKVMTYSPSNGWGTDTDAAGSGNAQNIPPAQLVYMYRRIK